MNSMVYTVYSENGVRQECDQLITVVADEMNFWEAFMCC